MIIVHTCYFTSSITKSFLLFQGKDQRLVELYPVALGLYGHWLAETRSENPGVIIDEYMEHVRDQMFISRIF